MPPETGISCRGYRKDRLAIGELPPCGIDASLEAWSGLRSITNELLVQAGNFDFPALYEQLR